MPQAWGEKRIVPINITEETIIENGEEKKSYRADLVPKVEQPLTVESIVNAAIADEYSEADQKRIMRKMANDGDPEVEAFKAFVNEVTESAKGAGYE